MDKVLIVKVVVVVAVILVVIVRYFHLLLAVEQEEVQEPVLHILDLVEELLFLVELIWDLVMDKMVMLLAEMDLAAVVLMENIKLVLPLLLGV